MIRFLQYQTEDNIATRTYGAITCLRCRGKPRANPELSLQGLEADFLYFYFVKSAAEMIRSFESKREPRDKETRVLKVRILKNIFY